VEAVYAGAVLAEWAFLFGEMMQFIAGVILVLGFTVVLYLAAGVAIHSAVERAGIRRRERRLSGGKSALGSVGRGAPGSARSDGPNASNELFPRVALRPIPCIFTSPVPTRTKNN